VIKNNIPAILHRLRDIAFEVLKIAIFGYPYGGFPSVDLRKLFNGCRLMAKVPNGEEKLPKISAG